MPAGGVPAEPKPQRRAIWPMDRSVEETSCPASSSRIRRTAGESRRRYRRRSRADLRARRHAPTVDHRRHDHAHLGNGRRGRRPLLPRGGSDPDSLDRLGRGARLQRGGLRRPPRVPALVGPVRPGRRRASRRRDRGGRWPGRGDASGSDAGLLRLGHRRPAPRASRRLALAALALAAHAAGDVRPYRQDLVVARSMAIFCIGLDLTVGAICVALAVVV